MKPKDMINYLWKSFCFLYETGHIHFGCEETQKILHFMLVQRRRFKVFQTVTGDKPISAVTVCPIQELMVVKKHW